MLKRIVFGKNRLREREKEMKAVEGFPDRWQGEAKCGIGEWTNGTEQKVDK